jgi:superfamily II DNA helicase RecQ
MQIKLFTIPIPGGEELNEEMNKFLRSRKVLQTEHHLVNHDQGAFWCFCIKYLEERPMDQKRKKTDYKEVLDEASFRRFSKMREVRKQIAKEEAIPAYAVLTDEEMAALAKIENLTPAAMRSVRNDD